MAGLLPHPKDAKGVIELLKPMVDIPVSDMWKGRKANPLIIVRTVKKHGIVKPEDDYYKVLNEHLFFRACNQVNEACNKIWATCELDFHLSSHGREDWLCKDFSSGYSPSSTIPTLYYADISSMVSILHFFGIGSFRITEARKVKNYDLVRTEDGFQIVERQQHLIALIGTGIRGWHEQVARLYEGLFDSGIRLPKINMRNFRSLKADREAFHYGLLKKTTVDGAYGEKRFFYHLPHVMFVTRTALALLRELRKPLHNGCDTRFKRLVPALIPMGRNHFSRFSPNYLRLEAQVDATLKSLE